jgi:hypothetical protein
VWKALVDPKFITRGSAVRPWQGATFFSLMARHFISQKTTLALHIPPVFSGNIREGVRFLLNQTLFTYMPEWNGVPICYSDIQFEDSICHILRDNPLLHVIIEVTIIIFRPNATIPLEGAISKISPHHIGLLVFDIFNASISKEELEVYFHWDTNLRQWQSRESTSRSSEDSLQENHLLSFYPLSLQTQTNMSCIEGGFSKRT